MWLKKPQKMQNIAQLAELCIGIFPKNYGENMGNHTNYVRAVKTSEQNSMHCQVSDVFFSLSFLAKGFHEDRSGPCTRATALILHVSCMLKQKAAPIGRTDSYEHVEHAGKDTKTKRTPRHDIILTQLNSAAKSAGGCWGMRMRIHAS